MPEGPFLGVGRPIATSSITLQFEIINGSEPAEVPLETRLRNEMRERQYPEFQDINVTVSEMSDPNNFIVSVITGVERVPHEVVILIQSIVEKQIGDVPERNFILKAT